MSLALSLAQALVRVEHAALEVWMSSSAELALVSRPTQFAHQKSVTVVITASSLFSRDANAILNLVEKDDKWTRNALLAS